MSKTTIVEIPSSNDLLTETDNIATESVAKNEDEETWLYENNKAKSTENIDNTTAPSIDEITTQEINAREKATVTSTITTPLIDSQLDDDSDDDDGIQVTIGDYEPEVSNFQTNRQKPRGMLSGGSATMPPKPSITRGIDFDAQGVINGQPTYDHDILNAYKDEEKPWKKPGADITEYFNYGFTEETWAQYCERQRRLRSENNLARLNTTHIPPMLPNHPPMVHPINSHPVMMINKPMNMSMILRPMNMRKPDGKIDVIGTTDHTSRRTMFETSNNFEHSPFINGLQFLGGQPPSGQTVGDLISTPSNSNGPPPSGNPHHIQTLGMPRLPMIRLPPGMPFRAQFGHMHAPGGPQFFPRGAAGGMHGDRLPRPYFVPHPAPQPWDQTGGPPVHNFPPGPFPPQVTASAANNNGRIATLPSRSPTPENRSSNGSTPEENRTSSTDDNDKSSKDDRYKEKYRDERDYHSSSRHRSSSSYHSRQRTDEYERPRNDRKSSRDRDDKYEHHSRKRQNREDNSRHHRVDDESSRSYRSSRRTPTKNSSSPSKINSSISTPTESSQTVNKQIAESDQVTSSSSSPANRLRHTHHKKSSKRSRHDSDDDERNSNHHRRQSKDRSKSSSKKSTNQSEFLSDVKEQNNE
ncbi:unnamed protein product [Rotaria sp. Silwood2]|nr:unnamed protein product [Rotaria sp. Silwood2]CAF2882361.1 unnamed protein product [Rotaria sp. Silwood2]CAF3128842.1 unnamed protein product [Rotaria sp. Silwood2]CAF3306822.1 unnamed protein product [Rotaria sp. Silwood2]CAF4109001.1 unnamed protein product [Rotaria sp. Silwood2]